MHKGKISHNSLSKMGYKACKKWAKKFYKKIGPIICPALDNQCIYFNNTGFTHLIRKMSLRSRNEQKRRFLLLPKVESIIKNPKVVIVYRKEEKKIYWTFVHFTDSKRIKVVIRQVGNGQKHFYSIMDKKVRKQKTHL